MSAFFGVELAPRDPILGLTEQFVADPSPAKVNLGVGVYLDETGKVPLLDCVRRAEETLAAGPRPYLPIDGLPAYDAAVKDLVFGADADTVAAGRVVTAQALGGTGALKIGADFLRTIHSAAKVLISNPSWENHRALFTRAGYDVDAYAYYSPAGVDFAGMLTDLRAAAPGTIVVLHACCHNPTGYDIAPEQWDDIVTVCADRGLVPFLDMAYQGFAKGIAEDSVAIGKFAASGQSFLVSTSFSKSMALYGERVGALSIVAADTDEAKRVQSQLKVTIRTNYSNPSTHGAKVAAKILTDPELRAQWEDELTGMRTRIRSVRADLAAKLAAAGFKGDTSFITNQTGMFSYTGLSKDQMVRLREEYHVYGTDAGRICVAAVNSGNIDHVAKAIAAVS